MLTWPMKVAIIKLYYVNIYIYFMFNKIIHEIFKF